MSRHQAVILGSRSPRRLELLRLIVPAEQIVIVPPARAEERGFEDARTTQAIEVRLGEIARAKCDDVVGQLQSGAAGLSWIDVAAVVTADTVIIATDRNGGPVVLQQPPADETWRETVRTWFQDLLLGQTHQAATALCVVTPDGRVAEQTVTTSVTFRDAPPELVDWYIGTAEPIGKAGGYALQGAGSVFVSRIEGSSSNVVGLPLAEVLEVLGPEVRGQKSEFSQSGQGTI